MGTSRPPGRPSGAFPLRSKASGSVVYAAYYVRNRKKAICDVDIERDTREGPSPCYM